MCLSCFKSQRLFVSADVEDVSKLISEGATVTVADIGGQQQEQGGGGGVIGRIVDETAVDIDQITYGQELNIDQGEPLHIGLINRRWTTDQCSSAQ